MKREPFCPIDSMIELIGSRSTLLILRELFGGPKRTSDLLKALDLSSATLLERLRTLERAGVLERLTYPEAPPRVEYQLTAKGRELQPVMVALRQVGAHWQSLNCATAEPEHEATCRPCQLNDGRPQQLQAAAKAAGQAAAAKRSDIVLL